MSATPWSLKAVGILLLFSVVLSVAALYSGDPGPPTMSEDAPTDTGGHLSAILSDGGTAYATIDTASAANVSLSYTYEDTDRLDGVYFLQNGAGPASTVIGVGDAVVLPPLGTQTAGEPIPPQPPILPRDPANGTPIHFENLTIGDQDPKQLLGIAVTPGVEATFEVNWAGQAEIEVHTLEVMPVILHLQDLEADVLVHGRFGPTQVEGGHASIETLETWTSQTFIQMGSGSMTYCFEAGEQVCKEESNWQDPQLTCQDPLVQGPAELALDVESQDGMLFLFTAVPYLFDTAPGEAADHPFECWKGTRT